MIQDFVLNLFAIPKNTAGMGERSETHRAARQAAFVFRDRYPSLIIVLPHHEVPIPVTPLTEYEVN
ncbi:MAG: hypothetical protein CVU57_14030 [Deltaproteobacteria bacterium HGW-Deltaproteobacteria-15]|jgi:hypothetical protein|nr:MAG: hypothetical protein CVU57_14030 [Deltaproteobacteria bacterium HGW-Deltaproteobacteria-15]